AALPPPSTPFPYTTLFRSVRRRRHLLQIALQLHQPVQLLQPQRRGRGRILRPGPEPVPPPEVAFQADQPLPRPQLRLQLKTLFRSEEHTSELQSRENLVCR